MARKNYTDEFRRRAVDLYESTPGATLTAIAADLGVSRGALKEWGGKLGSETPRLRDSETPRLRDSETPRLRDSETPRLRDSDAAVRGVGGGRATAAPGRVAGATADAALAARIRVLQDPQQGGDRASGAPRITADLTENAAESDRDFTTGEPGRRYVGDITYLPIEDGTNLCLASCIDLGSRKLAGWAMAGHMRTELVEDALQAAWQERGARCAPVDGRDRLVRRQRPR